MVRLARSGLEEGVWLRAERQSAGRGRHGRTWISPAGNLAASTLVRLRPIDPNPATLSLVAAVAVDETVRAYLREGDLALKWPNDLLLNGAKLAGILLERVDDAVVVGLGVNLAHQPVLPDRRTASLAAAGVEVAPADFLDTLADAFARWLSVWRGVGVEPVRARWHERAYPVGTKLSARLADAGAIEGVFTGLDADGALNIRLADGGTRVIHAADIMLG